MSKTPTLVSICLLASCLAGTGAVQAFCFEEAGKQYQVNPDLLKAMAQVESSMNPGAVNLSHYSKTRTVDLGLMQINSGWLGTLEKQNITQKGLLTDPCLNVKVGAWILADAMRRNGATWNGVGAYNAACTRLKGEACEAARMTYANKVWRALGRYQAKQSAPQIPELQRPSQIVSLDIPEPQGELSSTDAGAQ